METSKKVLLTVLPAIPLLALCHDIFLCFCELSLCLYVTFDGMKNSLLVTYPDRPCVHFIMNEFR